MRKLKVQMNFEGINDVPAGFSPAVFQKFLTAVAKPRRLTQPAHNTLQLAINESYKSK